MPSQWFHAALDAIGQLRGVALIYVTKFGINPIFSDLSTSLHEAHNALLAFGSLFQRISLERAGALALERAETQAMILRAARRVIRRRTRNSKFDVDVADVPSYALDREAGLHRIRVPARWREAIDHLGSATLLNFFLILDWHGPVREEPFDNGNYQWVLCAFANLDRTIGIKRLRWYRPDLDPAFQLAKTLVS